MDMVITLELAQTLVVFISNRKSNYMTYTDTQLKQALARMLPDKLDWREIKMTAVGTGGSYHLLCWKGGCHVLDTELLHLCWLVEEDIPCESWLCYVDELRFITVGLTKNMFFYPHATWQQRTTALCKVKGIEIV